MRQLLSRTLQLDVPLSLLRDELAGSELLPKPYDRYQPLLADALCFFLRRLSPVRTHRILNAQMRLPGSASTAERVVALLGHVPALHKLGQVVARDRRLTASFRHRLQQLESLAPQIPANQVEKLLNREFRNWRKAGIELGAQPLAEGSVAVIMPFVWREGRADQNQVYQGVFKLLKPGVCGMLEEDLEILSQVGEFLDQECDQFDLPALDYRDTFNMIRDLLLHEVRFDEEQQNLAEAAKVYGPIRSVTIPALFPFCSARLTAMERIFGQKIPSNGPPKGLAGEPLAQVLVQALIAAPIFSSKSLALFHADPHAGNLLVTPDGRLGILDWSLGGRLGKPERIELVQMMIGALTLDISRMERAVERLSQRKPDQLGLREILRASLCGLSWVRIPGVTWLTGLLDKLVLEAGLRPNADLMLFRKSLLTLEGVLADLALGNGNARNALMDEGVAAALVEHLIAEWPVRFEARLDDRSSCTHLSTADLVWLLWSAPATFTRWWNETGLEVLRATNQNLNSMRARSSPPLPTAPAQAEVTVGH